MITIIHLVPHLTSGVAETILTRTLEELRGRDQKHHCFYFRDGPMRQRIERAGVETHKVSAFRLVHFYRSLKMLGPDCLHAVGWSASILGRIIGAALRLRVIASIHRSAESHSRFARFVEFILPWKPDKFVTSTESLKRSMMRDWMIPIEKIIVLPHAVRAEGVVQYGLKGAAQIERAKDDFIVGAVGRFIPGSYFETLIESFAGALKFHPSARLILAGSGPLESQLRAQAAALPEGKVIIAICDEAYAYYPVFDCFVQPSPTEGASMELMEAVSIGLPVIVAAQDRRHPIIVDGQNGVVVAPGEIDEMTKAIYKVARDADLRNRLADEDRKTVTTTFSMKETAALYGELFEECARRG